MDIIIIATQSDMTIKDTNSSLLFTTRLKPFVTADINNCYSSVAAIR